MDLFRNNIITDKGLKNLNNIKHIDLTYNTKITDDGIRNMIEI